ncbi:hypothetical protein PAMC26510_03910 [Caballeronia sordidicola]|uniref:Superfamily III holin-X n=2 Tax=Caballeronia sordidicola TaxID=196367 RepID=A0A242N9L4_CABSO|nr:hypothetical protein PAMC26510_03910 [Caballeronia sordidicola]
MAIRMKFAKWRAVGGFCAGRLSDYSELLSVELAATKQKLVSEVIAMVALAVGVLFTLSFLCFAIIATAWQTPYFLVVVWAIAGVWLAISIAAYVVMRTRDPSEPFKNLRLEIERDTQAVKEALK